MSREEQDSDVCNKQNEKYGTKFKVKNKDSVNFLDRQTSPFTKPSGGHASNNYNFTPVIDEEKQQLIASFCFFNSPL